MSPPSVDHQLEILGLDNAKTQAEHASKAPSGRTRLRNRIDTTHRLLTKLPTPDDLTFCHSGLCQTFLPHSDLPSKTTVWERHSGRLTLLVSPGVMPSTGPAPRGHRARENSEDNYVGVPYGTKARLIMFHLQTEGLKGRTVSLGKNLSAFLRSLDLPRTGGPRGTIPQVREQCMRIARCTFTLQFRHIAPDGTEHTQIDDTKIVDGLELWNASSDDWSATVELSKKFHDHLIEHAVPLDRRSIALLAGNSVGLDLYALFAYRLPKLTERLFLPWAALQEQIGSEYTESKAIGRRVREVFPEVKRAYPHSRVEIERGGLVMLPSKPSVPKTMVNGFRVIE